MYIIIHIYWFLAYNKLNFFFLKIKCSRWVIEFHHDLWWLIINFRLRLMTYTQWSSLSTLRYWWTFSCTLQPCYWYIHTPSFLIHVQSRSLVSTNDHLLRELDEVRQRHQHEVHQMHWSYDNLKKTIDWIPNNTK